MHHRLSILLGLIVAATLLSTGCDGTGDDDDSAAGDDDDDDSYEDGCILVNGGQPGYARLVDAVYVAQDGDFITLCAGTFEGSVVIDKSVTITGVGGADTIVVGDPVETTLSIEAPDVSLGQMTVRSSRNGIDVANVTGVVLNDLILDEAEQYAVSINGGQLEISNVQISHFAFAGIYAQHGTLTASNLSITDGAGYGMRLIDTAASLTGGTISNITVPADTDDLDGTCVYTEDTPVAASFDGVEFSGCARVPLWVNGSDVAVSGCSFTGSNYGVLVFTGGSDGSIVSDSTFDDIAYWSIFVLDGDLEASGNEITNTSYTMGDTIGIYAGHDDDEAQFVISDNVIDGYGMYGIVVQPQDDLFGIDWLPSGGTATVSGNVLTNGMLYGMFITGLEQLTLSDNTITGVRWGEELAGSGSYYIEGGIYLLDIDDAIMTDNTISDVDILGITLYNTSFTSDGLDISETHLWAGYVTEAAGTFSNCNIHDLDINGIYNITASTDVDGCTFTNIRNAIPPDQWALPPEEQYAYSGPGLYFNESQGLVTNSTFVDNASQGIQVWDANVTIEFNEFTNNSYGVYLSGATADGYPITVRNNTFGDNTYYGLYTYDTDATISDNVIVGNMSSAFYASSFYGTFDGNEVEVPYTAIQVYAYDQTYMLGPGTFSNNTITGGTTGITCYYYANELILDGNTFDGVNQAIYLYDYYPGDESLTLTDNTFINSVSTPIRIEDFATVTFNGSNVVSGNASGDAVTITDAGTVTIDGLQVSGAARDGLSASCTTLTLTGSDLSSSTAAGANLTGSAGTMTIELEGNTAISANGSNGIELHGDIDGSITGNTIETNSAYGISCNSPAVVLNACANTMAGNGLGDFQETNGCTLGCTIQ